MTAPLPDTWCGTPSTDASSDAQYRLSNAPDIKVIYAYASDRPDRFSTYQHTLQGVVRIMRDRVAAASGDRKTLRFDMGTSCGTMHVDLGVLRLPSPAAHYAAGGNADEGSLRAMSGLDAAAPAAFPGYRNYLVFVDDVVTGPGRGDYRIDDTPGAGNRHNASGLVAMAPIYPRYQGLAEAQLRASLTGTALHEVFHTLGAVQTTAPHHDAGNPHHCNDPYDLMCPSAFAGPCPQPAGGLSESQLDCGGDDYFNVSPTPGSYLAQHWNTFDSLLLCALALCDERLGVPQVSLTASKSNPRVGETVTFTATGARVYQWFVRGIWLFGPGATTGPTVDSAPLGPDPITVRVRGLSAEGTWAETSITLTPDTSPDRARWPDRDGDGVPDSADMCPDVRGNNPSGCVTAVPAAWAFNIDRTPLRQKRRTVLSSGLRVQGESTRNGSVRVRLLLRGTQIGSGTIRTFGGSFKGSVKLTPAGKRRLRKRPGKVQVRAFGNAGGTDAVTVTVTK